MPEDGTAVWPHPGTLYPVPWRRCADGKWGSINENGQVIIEPTYTLNNNNEVDFIGEYYKYTYGYKKFNYTNDR